MSEFLARIYRTYPTASASFERERVQARVQLTTNAALALRVSFPPCSISRFVRNGDGPLPFCDPPTQVLGGWTPRGPPKRTLEAYVSDE
jgi:hypothetical protein